MLPRSQILAGFALFLLNSNLVLGDIAIYKNTSITRPIFTAFADQLKTKDPKIEEGKLVYIAKAEPELGCNGLMSPPKDQVSGEHEWWALIKYEMDDSLDCNYQQKAHHAIVAGFDGLILYTSSNDPEDPDEDVKLHAEHRKRFEDAPDSDTSLPSLIVQPRKGEIIKRLYTFEKGYVARIGDTLLDVPEPENPKRVKAIAIVTIIVGVIVVLAGIVICGVLARKLLNLNKN